MDALHSGRRTAARIFAFVTSLPNHYPHSYKWTKRVTLTAIVIAGSMSLSLKFTPKEPVQLFGQTVEVGAASPSISLSGPGQANLFGEGSIDTVQNFAGPVRPLIVWQQFNRNDIAGEFIQSTAKDGRRIITTNTDAVGQSLSDGWIHYFVRFIGMAGVFAAILFFLGMGLMAMINPKETGTPLKRRWYFLGTAIALSMLTAFVSVGVSALSAKDQLTQITTLADLVGSAKFAPVPAKIGTDNANVAIAVLGDSTAAGIGNLAIDKQTDTDKACYRSSDAYAVQLGHLTGQKSINLACSGANILNGILGPQYSSAGLTIAPQFGVLKSLVSVKTVILSIGANDVGWSDSVNFCTAFTACNDNVSDKLSLSRLDAFKVQFLQLLQQLGELPSNPTVIVNLYYDPFGDKFDCKALQDPAASKSAPAGFGYKADPGQNNQAQKIIAKIDPLRANLDRLNQVLSEGAKNFGFLVAEPFFEKHALCSDQPWIQGMDGNAPFHPTAAGEQAIAIADLQLIPKVDNTIQATGGTKPSSLPRSSSG